MPSKDPINLEANAWMESSDLERLRETASPGSTRATSPTVKSAAHVQALAARLGRSEADLVAKIPEDTLRRLKYPVQSHTNPDGSVTYERDRGIVEGAISSVGKDLSPAGEKRYDAPTRDARGRFVK
jgi:hypothetical protein